MSDKPFSPFLDKVEEYGKDKPFFRLVWCVGNFWLTITIIMYIGADMKAKFNLKKGPSFAKIVKTQWEVVTFNYKGNYKPAEDSIKNSK